MTDDLLHNKRVLPPSNIHALEEESKSNATYQVVASQQLDDMVAAMDDVDQQEEAVFVEP